MYTGNNPIEIWQNKLRLLRHFLRGWARHGSGVYKKEKERLISSIDRLDIKAEMCPLNSSESDELRDANDRL